MKIQQEQNEMETTINSIISSKVIEKNGILKHKFFLNVFILKYVISNCRY